MTPIDITDNPRNRVRILVDMLQEDHEIILFMPTFKSGGVLYPERLSEK